MARRRAPRILLVTAVLACGITEDRILGVRFDELDVPALVMFELVRE